MSLDRAHRARIVAVLGVGVFIGAVDLTVATTMLRQIIADLEIPLPEGFDRAAWIVNAYVVAYVAVMPLAGRLSDLWGRRRVLVGAITLFAAGSALAPFAASLGPFIACRVLAAVGGGAIVPVALAAVGDLYREGGRARMLGVLAGTETLGWVCGPLLGAVLVRFGQWRWHFAVMVASALVALALTRRVLRSEPAPAQRRRLDLPGAASLSVVLVALTAGLLESGEIASATDLAGLGRGGMPVWPFFAVAAAAAAVLVATQRRAADPILDVTMLRHRRAGPALGVNLLVGAVLALPMVNVPFFVNLVVETDLRRAAVVAGGVLTALTATMALGAPVGGWIAERTSYRPPILAGLALGAIATYLMGSTWGPTVTVATMAPHLALLGVGLGLVTAPLTAAVVDAVPAVRRGVAAAFVLISRLVGVSLGLAGLTAWAVSRFDVMRRDLDLPPITDPGYQAAVDEAQRHITATVLAETFLIGAALTVAAAGVALLLRPAARRSPASR